LDRVSAASPPEERVIASPRVTITAATVPGCNGPVAVEPSTVTEMPASTGAVMSTTTARASEATKLLAAASVATAERL